MAIVLPFCSGMNTGAGWISVITKENLRQGRRKNQVRSESRQSCCTGRPTQLNRKALGSATGWARNCRSIGTFQVYGRFLAAKRLAPAAVVSSVAIDFSWQSAASFACGRFPGQVAYLGWSIVLIYLLTGMTSAANVFPRTTLRSYMMF